MYRYSNGQIRLADFKQRMATLTKRPHFRSRRTRTCSVSVGLPVMMTKSCPLTHL